jgi:hypothetical protein
MKHEIKVNDRVLTPSGAVGLVTHVFLDIQKWIAVVEVGTNYCEIHYPVGALVYIPQLQFWNGIFGVDQIKPGCLVQVVDTGHFHHIVRFVTAESGEIYIQTTISDSITYAPDDLTYIG